MTRSLLTAATLFTAGMCVIGCRKTEVIAAPPERAITPAPQPVIIEHDRPAYGNTIIEHRPDGTTIEPLPPGWQRDRTPS